MSRSEKGFLNGRPIAGRPVLAKAKFEKVESKLLYWPDRHSLLFLSVPRHGIASLASAAISAERYAAIEKCTRQALAQYPDTTTSNQQQRSSVCEACMAAAGQAP